MRTCCILFFSLFLLIAALLSYVWMTQNEASDWLIGQFTALDRHDDKVHAHEDDEHEDDEHEDEEHDLDEHETKHLSKAQMQALDIEISQIKSGQLQRYLTLTGEIALNEDNLVHLVPRVEGIVLKVYKHLGDEVKKGDVMAVLESREVADAKAEYLASKEQLALAQDNYNRSSKLQKKRLISEQQFFEIKQTLLEVQIRTKSAARKLHALGFSDAYVKKLPQQPANRLTKYQMVAPIDGIVIEKHIVLGEVLSPESSEFAIAEGTVLNTELSAYVIADLSSVWVNFDVYPRDLPYLKENKSVIISSSDGIADQIGKISYVSPMIDRDTRTALIRSVLPNSKGRWRAGLFITGKIFIESVRLTLVVPKTAIQTNNANLPAIFVVTEDSYELQSVNLGHSDDVQVEILSGLKKGQAYVSKGGFILKAEMQKDSFAHAGHAH
ncbi:MAG: efflux RND transporter periplasmic adaptor subunit, partial [Pseudomonadota bacterium]